MYQIHWLHYCMHKPQSSRHIIQMYYLWCCLCIFPPWFWNPFYLLSFVADQVSVQISPPNTVPAVNRSLDLLCHNAKLPSHLANQVNQVVWYKDGQKGTPRENMQLLQNKSLHFDSLLPSDAGFYQCETYEPAVQQGRVFSLGYLLSCKYSWREK